MDWLAMIWGWALFGIRHRLSLTNDSKEATVWFFESIVFFFGLWRPSPFKGFVQQRRLTADLGSSGFGFGESEHHHFGHLVLEGHAEVFFFWVGMFLLEMRFVVVLYISWVKLDGQKLQFDGCLVLSRWPHCPENMEYPSKDTLW